MVLVLTFVLRFLRFAMWNDSWVQWIGVANRFKSGMGIKCFWNSKKEQSGKSISKTRESGMEMSNILRAGYRYLKTGKAGNKF